MSLEIKAEIKNGGGAPSRGGQAGGGGQEFITATAAREMLGCTKFVLARLLREGTLPTYPYPLDRRIKRVKRTDVERLLLDPEAVLALGRIGDTNQPQRTGAQGKETG